MFKQKGGGSKAFWTMFKKTALFWNGGFLKDECSTGSNNHFFLDHRSLSSIGQKILITLHYIFCYNISRVTCLFGNQWYNIWMNFVCGFFLIYCKDLAPWIWGQVHFMGKLQVYHLRIPDCWVAVFDTFWKFIFSLNLA